VAKGVIAKSREQARSLVENFNARESKPARLRLKCDGLMILPVNKSHASTHRDYLRAFFKENGLLSLHHSLGCGRW